MARNLAGVLARSRTFNSLSYRNYRLLWTGTLISHSGDWMDQLALNWLVLELTDSPFYLGLVNLCRAIPILLFTLIGGVVADRVERRKLLMVTQSVAMILAFGLAALVSAGLISMWQILTIATLRGLMMSFNLPARQTIISDLVPRSSLANAIALNSVTMSITKIVGPSLAGVLITLVGTAGCFYINGISFLAVLWTLYAMVFPRVDSRPPDEGLRKSLSEGLRYIRSQPTVFLLVTLAVVPMFFGLPYQTMLAVFAKEVLAIGPTGLGVLTSAVAVGAIIGGLSLASLGDSAPQGMIMLAAMMCFGTLLIVFSYSSWPPVSVLLLVGVGASFTTYNASNNSLLQMIVPDEFRGRILSTLFINRGLVPLGTALAGTLAVVVGIQLTVASMAAIVALLGFLLLTSAPTLRRLK